MDKMFIKNISITSKELEILKLIVKGYSNCSICELLCITNSTLRKHINNMYMKLLSDENRMHSKRIKLVLWYLKNFKNIDLESED